MDDIDLKKQILIEFAKFISEAARESFKEIIESFKETRETEKLAEIPGLKDTLITLDQDKTVWDVLGEVMSQKDYDKFNLFFCTLAFAFLERITSKFKLQETPEKLSQIAEMIDGDHIALEILREMLALSRSLPSLIVKELQARNYPAATALARIQNAFGDMLPAESQSIRLPGGNWRRVFLYPAGNRKPIQLELYFQENVDIPDGIVCQGEAAVAPYIDQKLIEYTDPLALKVIHAIFAESHRLGKGNYCWYDANTFLDMLGYKRDGRGYHRSGNKVRLMGRLNALADMTIEFSFKGKVKNKRGKFIDGWIEFKGSLIKMDGDTVSLKAGGKTISIKKRIQINYELWEDMQKKHFAWFDREFLKLDPREHWRTFLFYTYYINQLAIGAKTRPQAHIIKRGVGTVLREAGIAVRNKHQRRDWNEIKKAHEKLKEMGVIEKYTIEYGAGEYFNVEFNKELPVLSGLRDNILSLTQHDENDNAGFVMEDLLLDGEKV